MEVTTLAEIEQEFVERAHKMVWCNLATIDTHNRPRSRVVHPVWEGGIGWIGSRPTSHKTKHLAQNPYVSLAYVADVAVPVYIDAFAEWITDDTEKQRVWDFFKNTPAPVGYDPAPMYKNGLADFGVLKLTPWRIEIANMLGERQIWHSK